MTDCTFVQGSLLCIMKCGLLPMPPGVWWSVPWWYCYAWAIHLCIPFADPRKHLLHPLWPLWPWEQVWHLWCSKKKRSLFVLLQWRWSCPRLPTDTSRQDQHMSCMHCYPFFCFLTLIFTFLPLPPPQSHCSWATCCLFFAPLFPALLQLYSYLVFMIQLPW